VDDTEPPRIEAVGEDKLSERATGTLALSEPATGEDLLSAPAKGTPTPLADLEEERGEATSSLQERSATEHANGKKVLPTGKVSRIRVDPAGRIDPHNTSVVKPRKAPDNNPLDVSRDTPASREGQVLTRLPSLSQVFAGSVPQCAVDTHLGSPTENFPGFSDVDLQGAA
jgi:hypothetical protein